MRSTSAPPSPTSTAPGSIKRERVIATPQRARIAVTTGQQVLNLCANNYLGLADHPEVIAAAHAALDRWGYGLASVRFICGTQDIHKELEARLSAFLGTEDTILYSSCFDANGGLFETLLGAEDAVISDELNHASIIDGIRLCKAQRYRYRNNDLADLEARLQEADAAGARFKLIATDGVFSMDGYIANLPGICDLADRYGALVMVDDSHAVGFMGRTGRGTPEHCGVMGRVDIITGTLGKALGGASGGYTERPAGDHRPAPPAVAAVPVLQHPGAGDRRRLDHGAGDSQPLDRAARPARGQHPLFPRGARAGRPHDQARHASDRAGHDRRRRAGAEVLRAHAGKGRLRRRLLLSGRAAGHRAHPHPGLRRAHAATISPSPSRNSPR